MRDGEKGEEGERDMSKEKPMGKADEVAIKRNIKGKQRRLAEGKVAGSSRGRGWRITEGESRVDGREGW